MTEPKRSIEWNEKESLFNNTRFMCIVQLVPAHAASKWTYTIRNAQVHFNGIVNINSRQSNVCVQSTRF